MWKKVMASAVLLVLIGLLAWNLFGPKEPAIGLEIGIRPLILSSKHLRQNRIVI